MNNVLFRLAARLESWGKGKQRERQELLTFRASSGPALWRRDGSHSALLWEAPGDLFGSHRLRWELEWDLVSAAFPSCPHPSSQPSLWGCPVHCHLPPALLLPCRTARPMWCEWGNGGGKSSASLVIDGTAWARSMTPCWEMPGEASSLPCSTLESHQCEHRGRAGGVHPIIPALHSYLPCHLTVSPRGTRRAGATWPHGCPRLPCPCQHRQGSPCCPPPAQSWRALRFGFPCTGRTPIFLTRREADDCLPLRTLPCSKELMNHFLFLYFSNTLCCSELIYSILMFWTLTAITLPAIVQELDVFVSIPTVSTCWKCCG